MAHSEQTKAAALVLLMTGDSPRYVAKQTGVPLTTVKRWRNVDMRRWFREIFGGGSIQNGPKKETGKITVAQRLIMALCFFS